VCGVAAKTSTLKFLSYVAKVGRQGILIFLLVENIMGVATYYFGH
jgi:hypothetical protein